jgi:Lrp/AsnC family leucine-responsive transcriptional regulator
MAMEIDEIDRALLDELQRNADRPNVELARIIGLSPAATLHRVRRLKESGLIAGIHARLDPRAAGFPLQVHMEITLGAHSEAVERRFRRLVADTPQILSGAVVAGETDAILHVVARDVHELQSVILALSLRGGAQRIVTLLHLEPLKEPSPLPLDERPAA